VNGARSPLAPAGATGEAGATVPAGKTGSLVAIAAVNTTRGTTLAASVEVAVSFWGRFRGLMGRSALLPGTGLWIPATNGIHMFFMRFAIDAVFLSRSAAGGARRVVSVRRALPPWLGLVPLVRGADGVLELPTGTIAATGTEVGDIVHVG
jgi:uncharacterized membrane protein (UPF0127 family)